ncbi:MAG TPA: hypothetical protein VFQ78_05345 [Candidatus Udaeobacter sp.]|jgi:hypothetical protein|nr:hypothetical protein [Candidatus Udaeobacter sp.]
MKTENPLTKLMLLLLAVLPTLGLPVAQADLLPGASIGFAPIGLTMNQTARLSLANIGVPNGIIITWRFMDASGTVVTKPQEQLFLPFGKIVSVDFKRSADPLSKTDPAAQLRAEVRAQVDILTPNVSSESVRRSLEVFNNDNGATTICVGSEAQ